MYVAHNGKDGTSSYVYREGETEAEAREAYSKGIGEEPQGVYIVSDDGERIKLIS